MTLAERVRAARKAAGLNKSDLAREVGLSPSAVTQWENGATQTLEGVNLVRAAAAMRVSPVWLATGKGVMEVREPSNVEDYATKGSRLPLISWVSAGLRDDANDPYAPGNAEAWVDFEGMASRSAFCLRVRGQSMIRADGTGFPDGCLIAVEPRRLPKSGEFAVFRFNTTDEATFKQFVLDGPLQILRPLNPAYPIIVLSDDAQLVGTVFEKRIIEKF